MFMVNVKYWHATDATGRQELMTAANGPFGTRDTAEKFALMVAEYEETAEVQIEDTFNKDKK